MKNNYAEFINNELTELNKGYIRSADGIVSEVKSMPFEDGSYEQAYDDYVREEMNAIRSRQNN